MRKFSRDATNENSKLGLGFGIDKEVLGVRKEGKEEEKKKMMNKKVISERMKMMITGEV